MTRTRASRKAEWRRCSGLDYHADDIALRDFVSALFELEEPDEEQKHVLLMTDVYLANMDLPWALNARH